jgi:hypothetical protein
MDYAVAQKWVEKTKHGVMLTNEGYVEAQSNKIFNQCNETIKIERRDGSRYEEVPARVADGVVIVPSKDIPVGVGDLILRELPSKIVERLVVTDPGFTNSHGIIGHYRVKYRHESQKPAEPSGPNITIYGPNSRVNLNSIDNSINNANDYASNNLTVLGEEFARLREALLSQARSPEHYAAIGAVASAEISAKEGEPPKVTSALSRLGSAGKWALGIAKDIGVEVAAEAITKSAGV